MVASQILAVRFADAVTTQVPSDGKAVEFPAPTWSASDNKHSPVAESQILAVRSTAVVKTKAPSDENAADKAFLPCPANVERHSRVVEFQILAARIRHANPDAPRATEI